MLQRLQKESEDELEKARKILRKTENVVKEGRRTCGHRTTQKPPSKANIPTSYKTIMSNENREAIKRLTKVPTGRPCEGRSTRAPPTRKPSSSCASTEQEKESKELPKKPKLTTEEISALLDQEARDVESAWYLTSSEAKESSKKPCPKQQKARDAVKALMEPKEEPPPPPPAPTIPKEPIPFLDPDPDDTSPEVAANMMYMQERGVKMIACPEETVKQLFAEQMGYERDANGKRDADNEMLSSGLEDEADVDDSAFTRNMKKSSWNDQKPKEKSETDKDKDKDSLSQKEHGSEVSTSSKKTEFILQEKEAKCVNRVQLRGNCAPWFPGFYVAFPDQYCETGIQVAKSPSCIFQKAWLASKPQCVSPANLHLIE